MTWRPLSFAFRSLALLIFCLFTFALAEAQSATATLSGTVEDPNHAVVLGANVTVTNVATVFKREAITSDQGYFTVPLLPPGTYIVSVRRDGFAPVEVRDVVLNVGDQKALNIQLKAGDVNATVTVDSNAELIRTDSAVATVVDNQFVSRIPLNGRSLQSLITLTPGVVASGSNVGGRNAGMFSVNGQRANANYFTVDGVSANVANNTGFTPSQSTAGTLPALTVDGGTNSLVSVDALQEFKIQTSTYAAEFGRQPGGQISFVTRSGANDFHGIVFEYIRNEALDANDWFANANRQPRPPERQHDFGAVFSGPLFLPRFGEGGPSFYSGRNRTFFFFSYEGLRLTLPRFALTNVPTTCLRALGGCATGQSAGAAELQPILRAFPLPNGRDLGNGLAEFSASYGDRSRLNATSLRIDHVVGRRLTLFGRFNKAPSSSFTHFVSNLAILTRVELDLLTVTMGATYSPTSRMSNELRANYSKNDGKNFFWLDSFRGSTPIARSILIPPQFDSPTAAGSAAFLFPGRSAGTSLPTVLIGTNAPATQCQINVIDNFTYTVRSHQLKFGADYRRLMPTLSPNSYSPSVIFLNQSQVVSNQATSGSVRSVASANPLYTNFSLFGQDTWKISRRVTLSLGLRWEVNPPPDERSGNKPLALTEISDLRTTDISPRGTPLWKTSYNNFAPRVGVAYQLSQTPGSETIIRGGFGVFYDVGSDQGSAGFNGFPFTAFRSVAAPISFPLNSAQFAPPVFPNLTPPYTDILSNPVYGFDPNLKLPYTLQWNVALERSLGKHQTVSASYVGAAGRRLLVQKQLRLTAINPKFTTLNLIQNGATSDYNGLQVQFQRRLSGGFQALASYSWSHAIDESSSDFTDNILIRGNADFDVRHNFTSALVYDIPGLKVNSVADTILNGWSVDSRITVQSAFPLNITAGQIIDPSDGTVRSRRPSLIQGAPFYLYGSQYPGGRTLNNAIPTAAQIAAAGCAPFTPSSPNAKGAFCTPPTGVQGTLGRNVVRGLPIWQVDMALNRRFKLTEKVSLQFRAEAFNLFNHPNFGQIQTSISNVNFGQATNMLGRNLGGQNVLYQLGGPRSFQFALRLGF